MSSPFPGMDPYIEQSGFFRDFHTTLNAILREQLNMTLPPGYAALAEERVVIYPQDRNIGPDVFILRKPIIAPPMTQTGGAAILTPTAPHQIEPLSSLHREYFIEIRSGSDWSEVVTVIEILSPTNKRAGQMRDEYLSKQQDILRSETSLLEIDLLRSGAHTVAAPIHDKMEANRWHYVVSLSPAWRRGLIDYWPFTVRDSLPIVPVPLKTAGEGVMLDLQAAFDRVYNGGAYPRLTDYRQEPPDPPFVGQDAVWLDRLLREKGLRPSEECPPENSEGSA